MFYNEIRSVKHGKKPQEKIVFLKNLRFLYDGRKNINSFKGNIFPVQVMGDSCLVKASSTT